MQLLLHGCEVYDGRIYKFECGHLGDMGDKDTDWLLSCAVGNYELVTKFREYLTVWEMSEGVRGEGSVSTSPLLNYWPHRLHRDNRTEYSYTI